MKITKQMLKQIIKEELQSVLSEQTSSEKLALDTAIKRSRDLDPGWTGRAGAQVDKALTNVGQTARRAGMDAKEWWKDTTSSFAAAREVMPGGGGLRVALRHKKEGIHQGILDYIAFSGSKAAVEMVDAIVDNIIPDALGGEWEEEYREELRGQVRHALTRAAPDIAEWITSALVGEDPKSQNCPPCPACKTSSGRAAAAEPYMEMP